MNPYELLGVAKTASDADIKAAYRRKARAAHSDLGGDDADMAQLNVARDILLDPERRQRYDATGCGDAEEKRDPDADAARNILLTLIDNAIESVARDIVSALRDALQVAGDTLEEKRGFLAARRAIVAAQLGKHRYRGAGDDLIEAKLTARLADIDQDIAAVDSAERVRMLAVVMSKDYESLVPPPIRMGTGNPWATSPMKFGNRWTEI